MLRRLAGICCGGLDNGPSEVEASAAQPPPVREVVKPTLRLDEDEAPTVTSMADLVQRLSLTLAPPGAVDPVAVSTADFPRNVNRLVVLLPSPGAPPGSWDTSVGSSGNPVRIIRWAQANGFAACLFSSAHLEADPGKTWDRVLRGSPAAFVFVLAANGALPMLARVLMPVHSLLYSRFRLVVAPFEDSSSWPPSWPEGLSEDLVKHLANTVQRPPAGWASQDPRVVVQLLFEELTKQEYRFQRGEAKKYGAFQNLKENDMPGLKRLGMEQRVKRLDRDRGSDELSRIMHQNEHNKFCDEEDEPGVD